MKWSPPEAECPYSAFFWVRRECMWLPREKSALFSESSNFFVRPLWVLLVENLWTFQKGAGVVTVAPFQATNHLSMSLYIKQGISVCLSVSTYVCMYVLRISQELFIQSTSYSAGALLGIQGSAVSKFGAIWTSKPPVTQFCTSRWGFWALLLHVMVRAVQPTHERK